VEVVLRPCGRPYLRSRYLPPRHLRLRIIPTNLSISRDRIRHSPPVRITNDPTRSWRITINPRSDIPPLRFRLHYLVPPCRIAGGLPRSPRHLPGDMPSDRTIRIPGLTDSNITTGRIQRTSLLRRSINLSGVIMTGAVRLQVDRRKIDGTIIIFPVIEGPTLVSRVDLWKGAK
jgi:hypothetical protein